MMERASEAFRLISRGAYRALTTAPNGQSETLIALGADGGSKEAAQLSKGARFQLYLALRVAGYHELARTRAPAPFVADDIMETFDHFRAEEALRLFADMGRVGQVIYFTHHRHLAEIAESRVPGSEGARAGGLKGPHPALRATFSHREKGPPPSPSGRGVGVKEAQLCTPLTYQSMTARSLSSMRCPLATRSLPVWSMIGPANTSYEPSFQPAMILSAAAFTLSGKALL